MLARRCPPPRPIAIDPQADFKAFRDYFTQRFPNVPLNDFVNGPYSMDADLRKQWLAIEDFPPYDFAVDKGKDMFATPFKNGKNYGDCFADQGIGIRQNYPYFDDKIRRGHHARARAQSLPRGERRSAVLLRQGRHGGADRLYGVHLARQAVRHQNPERSARARRLSNGEKYFYTRRGQLNFSCASCHVQSPGEHIRTEVLAPALGILAAMPIYRSEWGGMGTISRRFVTCNSQVRGVPLEPQDEDYRDVEYFLSYMSNGLPISGPGARP